jgi:GH18 family chitinase
MCNIDRFLACNKNLIFNHFYYTFQIYRRIVALKKLNPGLKVMLSVGQMSMGGGFHDLVESEAARKR